MCYTTNYFIIFAFSSKYKNKIPMEGNRKISDYSNDELTDLFEGLKRVRTIAGENNVTDAAIRKQIRVKPDRYRTFTIDGVLFICG